MSKTVHITVAAMSKFAAMPATMFTDYDDQVACVSDIADEQRNVFGYRPEPNGTSLTFKTSEDAEAFAHEFEPGDVLL